ncbi:MAG: TonB-dependent receptor plug domain-containing protein [Gemmatimonadaceae bacterium]
MRVSFRAPLLAIALLAATEPALAQAAADSAKDSTRVRLKAVTVTSTRAAAVVGGASAAVVVPDQLRASPAPLLDQALREAPFVHVRQNSRGEMELSVRGSDSRQAAVMLHGIPMTLGWDHRADPSLIPITGSQSIVIVRGLGTLLNGPNTLGGSVEVNHERGPAREAWASAGFDHTSALVTSLGGGRELTRVAGGPLAVRGGFAYRKRDGFKLPSGAKDSTATDGLRTNSDLRHVDGFASLNWSGAMGRRLSFDASAFDAERGVPPEEHIDGPRLWRYPYHTRAVASIAGNTGAISTPFGIGTVDVGVGYNSGRLKIETFPDRNYQTPDGEELGDERNLVGRARGTHSLGSGTLRAAITMSDISYRETLSGNVADYGQKLLSTGAEIEMPVRGLTTIAGGVVYDRASTPETGGRAQQEPFEDIGWRAGVTHEVNADWRLHASTNQRSRFPALRELYSGSLNRFQPNPDLKPETLLGFEAGFTMNRAMGNGTAVAEVTGFRHHLDDAVVRITVPQPTGPSLFRRINRDRIESSGVELLTGYTFGGGGDRAYSITGDATLQSIEIRDQTLAGQPERRSENNPETRGSLELGVPLPLQLRGIANARYTGTQYCLNADTGNEDTLKSQTETDLAVERNFSISRGVFRTLRMLVAMDNVGNATVYDQCGLPQPGRTARVMFVLR